MVKFDPRESEVPIEVDVWFSFLDKIPSILLHNILVIWPFEVIYLVTVSSPKTKAAAGRIGLLQTLKCQPAIPPDGRLLPPHGETPPGTWGQ